MNGIEMGILNLPDDERKPSVAKLGQGKNGWSIDLYDLICKDLVIVGMTGSGKSTAVSVIAEELCAHNRRVKGGISQIPLVILDPTGTLYGLRAGRNGGPRGGCKVLIVGGDHGDFELDATMGRRIADLVDAIAPTTILVEMDTLNPDEQLVFVADFAERLNESLARRPLHVLIDDADEFYPTSPRRGAEARCAAALDRLIRKRRCRGIATTMVASRPSRLNTSVTSQTTRMLVFGMGGPPDLRVVADHALAGRDITERDAFARGVAALRAGEAFHVTWGGHLSQTRVRFRRRKTFDSVRVPLPGQGDSESLKLVSMPKRLLKKARAILFPDDKPAAPAAKAETKQDGETNQNEHS